MPWRSINVFFSHRRKCEGEVRSITVDIIGGIDIFFKTIFPCSRLD